MHYAINEICSVCGKSYDDPTELHARTCPYYADKYPKIMRCISPTVAGSALLLIVIAVALILIFGGC